MTSIIYVCPFSPELIYKMDGLCLVVEATQYKDIKTIEYAVKPHNLLHCIRVKENLKLSEIEFNEEWDEIPISLYLQSAGNFHDWIKKIKVLRNSSIRIFLSSKYKENYISLNILSSLGIECGVYFENSVDWIALNDLMHYAVYVKVKHANIEPFHYLCENYEPGQYTDFNPVYFVDPVKYLYVNERGKIAATPDDLKKNNFLEFDIFTKKNIEDSKFYKEALDSYQNFFRQPDACSYCKAWRICLGKFPNEALNGAECKEFFNDTFDACDYYYNEAKKNKSKLWQI